MKQQSDGELSEGAESRSNSRWPHVIVRLTMEYKGELDPLGVPTKTGCTWGLTGPAHLGSLVWGIAKEIAKFYLRHGVDLEKVNSAITWAGSDIEALWFDEVPE